MERNRKPVSAKTRIKTKTGDFKDMGCKQFVVRPAKFKLKILKCLYSALPLTETIFFGPLNFVNKFNQKNSA